MKTILILRHAKSDWNHPGLDDFERPLNKRGKAEAPLVGQWLRAENLIPDRILCSDAKRARSTAKRVIEASGFTGEISHHSDLYLAMPEVYIHHQKKLPDSVACAMLIGHNPGLEILIGELSGKTAILPTAAVAVLQLPITQWEELKPDGAATLLRLWHPETT